MRKIKLLICFTLCVLMLYGCGKETEINPPEETSAPKTEETQQGENAVSEKAEAREVKDGKVKSYLSGEWVDEAVGTRRPVAIMLSNIQAAQPMSGVSYADVVYEYEVEGSITRLMGIFENYDSLEKIGSVRSCREYFVYGALEFDAIYVHYGQAAYAEPLLEKDYVNNLNGLGPAGNIVFYRTNDRVKPHNCYASAEGIEAGIKKFDYRTQYRDEYEGKFNFVKDGSEVTNSDGKRAYKVDPKYKTNQPWFEYNESDGLYYRFQYGEKHIDELTGKQISYKNIILQYANWVKLDDNGYLGFDCHVGGPMQYITNGKMIEGTWKREPGKVNFDEGAVKYFDADGKEIEVNTGKTFVCVIQNTMQDKVVIE